MNQERKDALLERATKDAVSSRAAMAEVIGELEALEGSKPALTCIAMGNAVHIRDHFAGLAMQTCLAADLHAWQQNCGDIADVPDLIRGAVLRAYEVSDAMLSAREGR